MIKNSGLKLSLVIILVIVAAVLTCMFIGPNINLGLDLKGGVHVVMEASTRDGSAVTNSMMEELQSIMRNRVDEFGIAEPTLQLEGDNRLIVEIAGIEDPEQAIEMLGKTAVLEFRDEAGTVLLSGDDLAKAEASSNPDDGTAQINLEFSREGSAKFAEATTRLVGQPLYIYLDDECLTYPTVSGPITNGSARITGHFTYEEASQLAALLRGGALPMNVEIIAKQTVGPTLGQESLDKSLKAGIIGLIVLFLFMIFMYRLPGAYSAVAFCLYIVLLLWILSLVNATLTLTGIAGLLLSIGMAVDSNIIIFERIKEELRAGKSLRAGIDSGFKRAFGTILDSNVTTLIAAIVLYFFGTGTIKGFAVTLSIGILVSMFTAITFTRFVLRWSASTKAFSNSNLYGAKGGKQ